ncbi:MAG: hypothetical protein PUC44_04475 [Eubacteriales bacterium]|nr:hypothetical protein [Eubacteriales bacterium]
MNYQEYVLNRQEKIGLFLAGAAFCLLTGILFYDSPLPMFLVLILYKPTKLFYSKYRLEKIRKDLRTGFQDFLNFAAISFSSGRHLAESVQEAEKNLEFMYRESAPILQEIRVLRKGMEKKEDEVLLLRNLYDRCGIEEVRDFLECYEINRSSGGNLIHAMENTARMISEKIRIEKEIEIMGEEKKLEGRILLLMPFLLLTFLRISSPDYIHILYEGIRGRFVMTAVLALLGIACFLTERILKIEI